MMDYTFEHNYSSLVYDCMLFLECLIRVQCSTFNVFNLIPQA
jgi:hypothetical protein